MQTYELFSQPVYKIGLTPELITIDGLMRRFRKTFY